jgi:CBS domain-containing membrane protein
MMTNPEVQIATAAAPGSPTTEVPTPHPDLRAADVMAVELLTVDAAEGLLLAWELVSQAGVHHVPVLDDGRCIGLLAERELALEVERNPLGHSRRLVRELIDDAPAFVAPGDLVGDVAATLLRTGKDAVLVQTDDGVMLGVITERDLLRALAGQVLPRTADRSWDHAPTLFQLTPVLPRLAGAGQGEELP